MSEKEKKGCTCGCDEHECDCNEHECDCGEHECDCGCDCEEVYECDVCGDIVEFETDDGRIIKLSCAGSIEYKGKEYSAFLPTEFGDGIEEGDVFIFELVTKDDKTFDYVDVKDEKLLEEVFDEFCRVMEEDELAEEAASLEGIPEEE